MIIANDLFRMRVWVGSVSIHFRIFFLTGGGKEHVRKSVTDERFTNCNSSSRRTGWKQIFLYPTDIWQVHNFLLYIVKKTHDLQLL